MDTNLPPSPPPTVSPRPKNPPSFPGSSLYVEKVPWLWLVTCLWSRVYTCQLFFLEVERGPWERGCDVIAIDHVHCFYAGVEHHVLSRVLVCLLCLLQPRSQGPLSTSRKYPGYGWSHVYTCQLQTHRGWVLNKLQLQLQLSSPSLRSYLWNLLKSSRHVTSCNQGTFSR